MAQSTSNVAPAAQTALKNMQSLNFGSSLGQLQQNNANISRFANPSLVVTPSGKIAPKTTGIGPVASATGYGGMINPRTVNPAKTQPLASSSLPGQLTGDQSSGNPYANLGDAKTPEQLAAEAKARGATSGLGSLLPGTDATATSNTGTSSVYSQTNPATYSGLVTQLANTSSQPSADYLKQQEQANAYNEALKQSRMNEAGGLAANAENPIPLEFQTGRAQVLQSQYAQEQAALGSAYQGASNLQQAANTQQQTEQSGLGAAAGYASPTGNYPFVFNPLNQSFTQAGGGVVLTPQQAAQDVISEKTSYDQAKTALGYMGQTGEAQLQSAITAAGGNPLKLQAQGATQQSNIQTGGTAATSAAATGLQQSTQAYVSANTAYTTAQKQSSTLQQTMASTGINSANSQLYNSKINALQNQFGSTKYPAFITALNETKQAYTNLLSSVGASTPTVNGQQATDIFNENSTPQQIDAAISALNTAAYNKLQPMYDQIQTYASQLGGGGSSSGNSSGAFSDSSFYGNK